MSDNHIAIESGSQSLSKRRRLSSNSKQIATWMHKTLRQPQVVQLFVKQVDIQEQPSPTNLVGYFDDLDILAEEAYQASKAGAEAVFFSLNPLNEDLLARCRNRLDVAKRIDAAKNEDVLHRRLLLIDLDARRPAGISSTNEEKAHAADKLEVIYQYLRTRKWPPPIQVDSGNGFHLLYRIDLPTDDEGLISRCLKTLSEQFSDDKLEVDTTVHNAVRLCKVPGTIARKGEHTKDRPHRRSRLLRSPKKVKAVPRRLIEDLVDECGTKTTSPPQSPISDEHLLHARHYVDRMPEAVSGQHGHSALFAVACRLIIDFSLSIEDALPILREYNTRCKPPWTESELKRKLQEAEKQNGERGRLVITSSTNHSACNTHPPSCGTNNFCVAIPDFTLFDKDKISLCIEDFEKIDPTEPILWREVWRQQRTSVIIPDLLLQQCRWGANAPRNWHRDLKDRLSEPYFLIEDRVSGFECLPICPLHQSGKKHQHYGSESDVQYGLLEQFTIKQFKSGHRRFDFFGQQFSKERAEFKRHGKLFNVFWPLLLFADSLRIKMPARQQLLMLAIIKELTHAPDSRRTDKALVVANARVAVGRVQQTAKCPLLDPERRYVVFGGNGNDCFRGKGYRLLGSGWLPRAGYTNNRLQGCVWARIGEFLDDLDDLEEIFQLTVVARHSAEQRWLDLCDLKSKIRTKGGREFLRGCIIRIFAPEDYLTLWRAWFAQKLGFDWIPTSPDDLFNGPEQKTQRIRNGDELREFLQRNGMTQQQLADRMGTSRERVNRHITGRRNSPQFFQELDRIIDEIEKDDHSD